MDYLSLVGRSSWLDLPMSLDFPPHVLVVGGGPAAASWCPVFSFLPGAHAPHNRRQLGGH